MELLRVGRVAEAEQSFRSILADEPANAIAAVMCAQAMASRGNIPGAAELLETTLRLQPDSVAALNGLASLSLRLGRLEAARAACVRSLEVEPNNAPTHFNRGLIEDAGGHLENAVIAYDRAIELDANFAAARLQRAVALQKLGRLEEAIAAYGSIPAGDHGEFVARFNLGMLHQERGELAEAAALYARASDIAPSNAAPRLQLGNVLYTMGRFDQAVVAYREALARKPDAVEAHGNLAKALWARSDSAAALAACEAGLRIRPGDSAIIAFKAVLLRETGDDAGASALVDVDRFLMATRLAAPAGFDSLDTFNASIAQFALRHPTLQYEPRYNATKDGKHTADLLAGPKGPVAVLQKAMEAVVWRYIRELPPDAAHPFVASRPARWRMTAWAVVMEGQGYQAPHIHPHAWLSGVYYVSVPAGIAAADADHAGWIEFGEPLPEFRCKRRPDLRLMRPEPGLMLLFPSYFHHRTLPFRADATRISVAFDIIPTA
jgi:tetratricopeptide (TPR) repeat protein